jgi:hypothetical protein
MNSNLTTSNVTKAAGGGGCCGSKKEAAKGMSSEDSASVKKSALTLVITKPDEATGCQCCSNAAQTSLELEDGKTLLSTDIIDDYSCRRQPSSASDHQLPLRLRKFPRMLLGNVLPWVQVSGDVVRYSLPAQTNAECLVICARRFGVCLGRNSELGFLGRSTGVSGSSTYSFMTCKLLFSNSIVLSRISGV